MNVSSVADIIRKGGTMLGSARSKEFMTEEGLKKAINTLKIFVMKVNCFRWRRNF